MRVRVRWRIAGGVALTLAIRLALGVTSGFAPEGVARADAPDSASSPPDAEHIAFAAREHDLGYAAYSAKNYDEAATHFENAFFAAPNPQELKAAIRARRDAGEYAHAATLGAVAERRYKDDTAMEKAASDAIAEARPHVFEITVKCSESCEIVADGKLVPDGKTTHVRFFVDPGHHDLAVAFDGDRSVAKSVDGSAGGATTLEVAAPPKVAPLPSATASIVTAQPTGTVEPPPPPPPSSKPFGPAVFGTLLGLTVIAGGATIFSGIQTENDPGKDAVMKDCVGKGTSCPQYQTGLDEQRRTNILIGVTGGLGAVTLLVAAFFTQWSSTPKDAAHTSALDNRATGTTARIWPIIELGGVGIGGTL